MYFRALHALLNKVWNEGTILAEISRLETQLTPVVVADPWYATAKDWDGNRADFSTSLNLLRHFVESRRSEIQIIIDNPPNGENLLAIERKQNKASRFGPHYKNNSINSKGNKNITQQQIEGWINYFRTVSEQEIYEAIQSQKFRALSLEIKEGILNQAEELKLNPVVEKIKKNLEK